MSQWTLVALACVALAADGEGQCLVTRLTGELGVANGGFGSYLAAQGDELFVASLKSETTRAHPGSIYAMRREGRHWYREAEIVAPDEVVRFSGIGLTVEGDTLVAGGCLRPSGQRSRAIVRLERRVLAGPSEIAATLVAQTITSWLGSERER
ncbi:MAG: hypothetical protein HOP15_06075 [Planctomycetes bacterium]|nr:hypothetical protein [Planctomycetota bacterium]